VEPRLAKKLVDPLTSFIGGDHTLAITYEAIATCIAGLNAFPGVMKLCSDKLRDLVDSADNNGTRSFSSVFFPPLFRFSVSNFLFYSSGDV
jgi:hypothetical protein